ncbi:MAG: hypothetical protein PHG80_11600 [Methanoregulaceae archaeon]|nr:hypothetical protein [Methanoregulaceae archaeon]
MRLDGHFDTGMDRFVWDVADYLRSRLDAYVPQTREVRVRAIAQRFKVGWSKAEFVFEELYKLGVLKADYGFYAIARPSNNRL